MNLQDALTQVRAGRKVTRPSFGEYVTQENLDDVSFMASDAVATDWEVVNESVTVTEAQLISAWNESLPPGSPEVNKAPNSARFGRFKAALGL